MGGQPGGRERRPFGWNLLPRLGPTGGHDLSVRIPDDVHRQAKIAAAVVAGISLNEYVTEARAEKLERDEKGTKKMARKSSLTNSLYRAARASATLRAASKGPAALGKRQVRRAVYRREGSLTRKIFKNFGL
jgi:hypothetical protein